MDKGARAARLVDQIRDYLSQWIHEDYPGSLISVSDIQLSTNGQQATVWLSGFEGTALKHAQDVALHISKYQHRLQRKLQRRALPTIRAIVEPLQTVQP